MNPNGHYVQERGHMRVPFLRSWGWGPSVIGHSHHATEVLQKEFHHSPFHPHAPKWGKKQHSNDKIRAPYTFYHIRQPEKQNQSTSPILLQKTTTQFLQNMWCNMLLGQLIPKKKVLNVRNSVVQFQFCFEELLITHVAVLNDDDDN
jgi:hypothetical protein